VGLESIRIILVEPQGPLNIGSVARVMKNMGLQTLLLVNPRCDFLGEEARLMAVHGWDILETAQRVETIPEALKGCKRAIATTSRVRDFAASPESPKAALPWLLEDNIPSALIFGPEDRGLSNIELNYAQRLICIPSTEVYPSLNLAQSVAICCYELYQIALDQEKLPQLATTAEMVDLASLDMLEGYYEHLEAVLLKIGYIYPHTASSRLQKFRYLFNRATPTKEEVTMLRGILRQIEWAIKTQPKSGQ
jgi:tRNA/rRNA methyltransferase